MGEITRLRNRYVLKQQVVDQHRNLIVSYLAQQEEDPEDIDEFLDFLQKIAVQYYAELDKMDASTACMKEILDPLG